MNRLRWHCAVVLLASLAGPGLAQQQIDADTALARAEFRAAYERARVGMQALEADSETLQAYVLYPYLQAMRLGQGVTQVGDAWTEADEEASGFLAFYSDEPVTRSLRYTWLRSLARREAWQAFLERYREDVADAELECDYLRARIEVEDLSGLAPLIIDRYLSPFQLPIACEPVFQWLRDAGFLTDDVIEQRVRLLLDNGQTSFGRVIARRLPQERAASLLAWADLLDRPAAEIDRLIATGSASFDRAVLLDAWARLSRDDPGAALERFEKLVAALQLDGRDTSSLALALALGLAWDRRPESLAFFARVDAQDLDDYALEWQARAALWSGDWPLVRQSIAAMSARQRGTAQWRYWAARAGENRDERRSLFESTLGDDNYFSAMSAAHLRDRMEPHLQSLPVDASAVAALGAHPAFIRARELLAVGLPVAAVREWRNESARLGADDQQQSIHLAMSWQWFDLAVATATQHSIFNDYELLYPTPYRNEVGEAVAETGLESEVIYAVMRQESLYRADAVSGSGARGLLQLKPGTANQVSARLRGRRLDPSNLLDPAVNIHLGAAELERLLQRYDGQLVVALAAYNAGPAAVDRWLPEKPMDADIWVANIPYNETRDYVRRVLWHTVVFQWLESGRAQDTRSWLEPVTPGIDEDV